MPWHQKGGERHGHSTTGQHHEPGFRLSKSRDREAQENPGISEPPPEPSDSKSAIQVPKKYKAQYEKHEIGRNSTNDSRLKCESTKSFNNAVPSGDVGKVNIAKYWKWNPSLCGATQLV